MHAIQKILGKPVENNAHNITLRSAIIEDVDALMSLLIDTISHTCKNDYSPEQIAAWSSSAKKKEHWDAFIHQQYSLVAEIENKTVGFGSLAHGNHVFFMYIHKNYMGRGVAGHLYNMLEKESIQRGHTQISANVSKTARPFFEKKGFEVTRENINKIGDTIIVNYRMVKDRVVGH